MTLLACEMTATVGQFEHSLSFPFFEIGMKTDLFQSCGNPHWYRSSHLAICYILKVYVDMQFLD